MAFVIPDIKEVYEMKKIVKELDPTIQANQLVILKNNLQEALNNEDKIDPNKLRKEAIDNIEQFNDYHKLIGPKRVLINRRNMKESHFKRISEVIHSDDFKMASSYREQVGILCSRLRRSDDEVIPYSIIGGLFNRSGGEGLLKTKRINLKEE